jgi:hypothetical protein
VMIIEDATANAQYHRAMPPDQRREGGFGEWTTPRHESIHKFPVGQPGDCSDVENQIDIPNNRSVFRVHRESVLLPASRSLYRVMPHRGSIVPN